MLHAQNTVDQRRYAPDALSVKFMDGTSVKAEKGRLVVSGFALPAELENQGYWRAVHRVPAGQMNAWRATAERTLGA